MIFSKIHVGFLAALMVASAPQTSVAVSCRQSLLDARSKVTSYVNEVRATKGRRLLVAPPSATPSTSSPLGFFQHEIQDPVSLWKPWTYLRPVPYWLGRALTRQADTRFSPGAGVWTNSIDRPTRWITRRFSPPDYQPTFLAKLPMIVAVSFLTQSYVIEPASNYAFDEKIEWEIAKNKNAFDFQIQNDFRFRSIKEQLHEGTMDTAQAEHSAYMISEAYTKYYAFRDSKEGVFTLEDNMQLLDRYLFLQLQPVMTGEVKVPPGFVKTETFQPRLNDGQRQALFDQTHALYLKYQLADVYVDSLSQTAPATSPSWLTPYLSAMHDDPFVAALTEQMRRSKITAAQMKAYLMENYFWSCRIASWTIVGLNKINPETGAPVVLADYQSEMLKEISSR